MEAVLVLELGVGVVNGGKAHVGSPFQNFFWGRMSWRIEVLHRGVPQVGQKGPVSNPIAPTDEDDLKVPITEELV